MTCADSTEPSTPVITKAIQNIVIAALALVVAFLVLNTFIRHLTPDPAVYLLNTRTYLQEFNRYTASYESKGIVLTWWLVPWMAMLGANIHAAAMAQLVALAGGGAGLYRLLRTWTMPRTASIVVLIAISQMLSQRVWGGSMRPEVVVWGITAWVLVAAVRGSPRWLMVGGALAACCVFVKLTLALTPVGVLAVAGLYAGWEKRESRVRVVFTSWMWSFLGFLAACVLIFGWIVLFDDLAGWYRQTVEWPLESRQSQFEVMGRLSAPKLLDGAKVQYLYLPALIGLILAFRRGHGRLALGLCSVIVLELLRIQVEGALWVYMRGTLVTYILVATSLVGLWSQSRGRSILAWSIPVLLVIPMLVPTQIGEAITAFRYYAVEKCPPPYELAAEWIRPRMSPGETLICTQNDQQLHLLLDVPQPYFIPTSYYPSLSPDEQREAREAYIAHPPTWVVSPSPGEAPSSDLIGYVDFPYFVQCTPPPRYLGSEERMGPELTPVLPSDVRYRMVHDTGYLEVWKRDG